MRDHFQSRDKDGGHAIRSFIVESLMLHAKFEALCFYRTVVTAECRSKFYIAGIGIFDLCCFYDLDLDQQTGPKLYITQLRGLVKNRQTIVTKN